MIEFEPVAGVIGAAVMGCDLSHIPGKEQIDAIES